MTSRQYGGATDGNAQTYQFHFAQGFLPLDPRPCCVLLHFLRGLARSNNTLTGHANHCAVQHQIATPPKRWAAKPDLSYQHILALGPLSGSETLS